MKFLVLIRDFHTGNINIEELEAKNQDEAWEDVENNLINSDMQGWLLTEEEARQLKNKLNTYGLGE